MKLSELLKHVPHVDVLGNYDPDIMRVREIDDPALDINSLRWWNGAAGFRVGGPTRHGAYIVPAKDMVTSMEPGYVIIRCADPKASIIAALEVLYQEWDQPGFFEPGESVYGFNQILVRAVIGKSVCVGSFTTVGRLGFGFHNGQRFPHIGGVQIGDGVEIGSNACIDRGAIGDTIIGDRVKIDNLVHVAHNARIGADTLIVAGAVIGGSAVIGERCFIGMGALIKNKVRIGNDVTIGMGAVVTKDVPAGETWVGNPARKLEK